MKPIPQHISIFDLCTTYPNIIPVLMELGFTDLGNPLMRSTMGKVMTLPKASRAKGVSWDLIVATLASHGYEIVS